MNKTMNSSTGQLLSALYYSELRVVGVIPTPEEKKAPRISSATVEIFRAFEGESSDKPVLRITAHDHDTYARDIEILQAIDAADLFALGEHYTHNYLLCEGLEMAGLYATEFAPDCSVDVSRHGLKVHAEDLDSIRCN